MWATRNDRCLCLLKDFLHPFLHPLFFLVAAVTCGMKIKQKKCVSVAFYLFV